MSNVTFKTWTHPATGAVRIYLSNVYKQGSSKIWIEKCSVDSFGSDFDIKVKVDGTYATHADLVNEVESVINEALKERVKSFDKVIKLAK